MAFALPLGSIPATSSRRSFRRFRVSADGEFPSFLPKQVDNIKDPFARKLASRIERLPMWKSYIKKPMILVGPSLGAAVAIDFAVAHPEAVEKLVLIDASVYAEGTGKMSNLPKVLAYAGVAVLKSFPLRFYANFLAFNKMTFDTNIDWINIGCLHCRYPWWDDATVDFMLSGGYNVSNKIEEVKQRTLIIWGQDDKIIDSKLAMRLHCELPNAILRQIPDCGHIPHVERPSDVVKLISEFVQERSHREVVQLASRP